jgi:hypothetical protein
MKSIREYLNSIRELVRSICEFEVIAGGPEHMRVNASIMSQKINLLMHQLMHQLLHPKYIHLFVFHIAIKNKSWTLRDLKQSLRRKKMNQ